MTSPLFLVDPSALAEAAPGGAVVVAGAEGRHAVNAMRLGVGEKVLLADGAGRRVEACVAAVGKAEFTAGIESVCDEPAPSPRFVLVQALAKGGRDEQAIEAATELGVDEVVPWQAERSIVVWRADRAEKARSKWVSVVTAATKQSRRCRIPAVSGVQATRALTARLAQADTTAFVLHEDATEPLAGRALPTAGEVLVIVGPEGGIGEREMAQLTEAGAVPVRLGSEVLRSSSAGPAALAVLNAAGRWA